MTMAQTHNLAVQCHQWKLWEGLAILVDFIHHWTPIGTTPLGNLPASTLTSENLPFVCSIPLSLYDHGSDPQLSSTMPPMEALGRLAILVDFIHHWTPIGTTPLGNLPASTLTSENLPFMCSIPLSLYDHGSDPQLSSTMPPMEALGRIGNTC
jgi:uncharacterized Zn-finger protein